MIALQRPADVAFAPVVRREGELPVAEVAEQLLEVVERLVGRGDHITPRVEPEVLLEAEVLARRRHELPDPGRARSRQRSRIETALDHRQQRDVERHAALVDFVDDVVQIAPAAIDHPCNVLWALRIPPLPLRDHWAVEIRNRISLDDSIPKVIGRLGQRLEIRGNAASLDLETKVLLFQGVRELLTNTVKHARASQARVQIEVEQGAVRVVVEDDGVGLGQSQASRPNGFGLFHLRERLEHLGGCLEMTSPPGQGTRSVISILRDPPGE